MSFTDPEAPWTVPPPPGERTPLWMVLAAACADTALRHREKVKDCKVCGLLICDDHRDDDAFADLCEDAYTQVAAGSAEWADLAITLQAGMN